MVWPWQVAHPHLKPRVMVPQTWVIVNTSQVNVSNAVSFTEKETGFRVYSLALCHTTLEGQFLQTAPAFYLTEV